MAKCSVVKVFYSERFLSILYLIVWTYDVIGADTATYTQLSEEICNNAVSYSFVEDVCCHEMIEEDKHLTTCYKHLDTPVENVRNVEEDVVRLSVFTECLYKKRNYIKSDNKLNMARVKAEINRLYYNDILKKNFMINMYRYCAQKATALMADENPKVTKMVSGARKPYFMFHYLCVTRYTKQQCPYFIWNGQNEIDREICIDYADECVDNVNE